MKLTKTLDLLARPRGFEPQTLGLEMRGIGYTNDLVLHRFTPFDNILKPSDSSQFVSHGILYSSDGKHAVLSGLQLLMRLNLIPT